ncbi:MAG: ABC transporter ATP-binding protein [Pseudomonadota bacterium]|nr:ABC transporter ATP-binding protein [Pseudomonadota bacterium]
MSELLRIENLTKAYPGVVANSDVSFTIGAGEVHALLGENGAGKSTLVKMIYGLVKPDAGAMTLMGQPFTPTKPSDARAAGVAMVFQHFSLFDALSVAENVALGMENPPSTRHLAQQIREVSQTYGLPLDPDRQVGDLSAGERQRVEIIRCLLQDPKLLIMDEPTSVLTPQEVDILFETLRKLQAEGTSILYISHKLDEIRALCQAATVLRLGKVVGRCDPTQKTASELAEMMIGSNLHRPSRPAQEVGPVALEVKNLTLPSLSAFGTPLKDISMTVHKGQIFGIGGVAGNGQDELLAALSGEMQAPRAAITLHGDAIGHLGPTERRKRSVMAAPEERMGHAAVPAMSLTENAALTGMQPKDLATRGMIDWGKARDFAAEIIARFDVRTPGTQTAASALSGGNLQKFVIGREVMQNPEVLIVNQPTWGVDAHAAATIRQALMDLASAGTAVIVISQDLDELMEVSDVFAALNEGRLSAARPAAGLSIEEIGLMMGGAHDLEVAHVAG